VVAFSGVCEGLVRVAGKGDRRGLVCRFEGLQVGMLGKEEEGRAEERNEGSGRRRVPEWEGRAGWKPKFTFYGTAFLITCQGLSYVVMIRTACACGVS
jgi:hypothetical protein